MGSRAGLSHFQAPSADAAGMDLSDLVPSLKRALAAPGEFDSVFPESSDGDLSGTVADAVAECQLDGFLGTSILSLVDETVTPDLNSPQQALVILYAMSRVMTARLANLKNRTRYKAGNVEAETEQSASIIVELLRETNIRKKQLLEDVKYGNGASAFAMVDMYISKSMDYSSADLQYARGVGESRY